MAGSTVSITFKLNTDGKGWKDLADNANGLKAVMEATAEASTKLQRKIKLFNFNQLAKGIRSVTGAMATLKNQMGELAQAYQAQSEAETKLAEVMRQRMAASDEEIDSIKRLASEQQRLGVIGDEVQLAGAQQVATFLTQKSSIATLLPAMNNLIAQQRGLNATQQDAQSIGNLLGKAMQGQTSALTRVGITFSEAQAQVMKFGTESERAAMLAEIITQNVGEMNAALAATDAGKQKQLANAMGDLRERLGEVASAAMPYVTMASGVMTACGALVQLTQAVKMANIAIAANPIMLAVSAVAALAAGLMVAYRSSEEFREIVDNAMNRAKEAFSEALEALRPLGEAIGGTLMDALSGLGSALMPIISLIADALVIVLEAVCAVVKKLTPYIQQLGSFLKGVFSRGITIAADNLGKLLDALSSLVNYIIDHALAAIHELCNWLRQIGIDVDGAVSSIKSFLGFDGKQVKMKASVKTETEKPKAGTTATPRLASAAAPSVTTPKDNTPVFREEAKTLAELEENVKYYQQALRGATLEEAASINQSIKLWQAKVDAIKSAGEVVEEEVVPAFDAEANTLEGINRNISILTERLQTATIEEAAYLNQSIEQWQAKADAIKSAGLAVEEATEEVEEAEHVDLTRSWGDIKGIESSIEGMTRAVEEDGSAWKKLSGIIDGAMGIYQSVSSIIGAIVSVFTATKSAEEASAAASESASASSAVAAGTMTTALGEQAAVSTAMIAVNKELTSSYMELASSIFFAAHAYIPFAGAGIAQGFITQSVATVQAVAAMPFAEGGIVSGATLAYVGEYPNASTNPEVIAPLDKLRSLIGGGGGGKVEFKIRDRALVGVLANGTRVSSKSGRRTNISI